MTMFLPLRTSSEAIPERKHRLSDSRCGTPIRCGLLDVVFSNCDIKSASSAVDRFNPPRWGQYGEILMTNSKAVSEYVRPMLAAMARSIDAARAKRAASTSTTWSGSSEGTTPASTDFKIGSQVAANGKSKAKQNSRISSFFRDRDPYRKAG